MTERTRNAANDWIMGIAWTVLLAGIVALGCIATQLLP